VAVEGIPVCSGNGPEFEGIMIMVGAAFSEGKTFIQLRRRHRVKFLGSIRKVNGLEMISHGNPARVKETRALTMTKETNI
jgi:hypothetical protein